MIGWRLFLICALLSASACRGGVKSGQGTSTAPREAAPAVASQPATERRRAEYYKISDG